MHRLLYRKYKWVSGYKECGTYEIAKFFGEVVDEEFCKKILQLFNIIELY